ncbi:serine/threonine-protein kinase [Frankia sp. Cas3]|uniref:serine/threonine-protein kinase n=1 Tax=Frankia sp. Cas3 TaxID=3073926 RepID=UPI002AD393B5|nr:serine/threonine-protein kinase [Frankia sp. Cas3]
MARSTRPPDDSSRHSTPRYVSQRYRLDTPIGRGGAGVVWCGEDELLQRPVAIKEILVPLAGTQVERDAIRARVLREARALARLHSPAIVSVYDVAEEAERHWIVMELVNADSLGEAIRTHGPLPPAQVAAIGLTLVDALAAAHSAGVLHRDIKPGNVLLGRDGHVRLTDFGIAATEGDSTLTGTGALVGSPAYIAPERVRGSSGSPASDMWGLGATLYAAVEGQPPFEGPETYAVLTAVVEGRRRPFVLAGPLRDLLSDLLDRPAPERPEAPEIRQRLAPIAQGAAAVPAAVINGRSRPGINTPDHGGHAPVEPDSAGLEDVGGDLLPTGDSDADAVALSPTTAGGTTAGPSAANAAGNLAAYADGDLATDGDGDDDGPTDIGGVVGTNGIAEVAVGSAVREKPRTALTVGLRKDSSPAGAAGVTGTTALTSRRGTAGPPGSAGLGVDRRPVPDDGLEPVSGDIAIGPSGVLLDRFSPNGRPASNISHGGEAPVRRGVIIAVAAASVAVGAAIALGGILSPGTDSGQPQEPSGNGTLAAATTADDQYNLNPRVLPTGVAPSLRFSSGRRASPTTSSSPTAAPPVATEAVTPSPTPTNVAPTPTTPVVSPTPTAPPSTSPAPAPTTAPPATP